MRSSPIGARELRRRQDRLALRVGQEISELRIESNLTQAALASAAGIDPAYLSRIERGLAKPSLDVLVAVAACLGADLGMRLFPGQGPRIRDRFQAPMIECLIRRLHPRWHAVPEVAVPRARGVIDLALGLPIANLGIACEAQSELRALDLILRRLHEKTAALAELGTFGSETSSLLLLRSTVRNRDLVRIYRSTLEAAFPSRATNAFDALTGNGPWPGATIMWTRVERGRAVLLEAPPRGIRLGR